jgi:hypothetical protein
MNRREFKNIVDTRFASLTPPRGSDLKILSAIAETDPLPKNKRYKVRIKARKPLVVLIAIILCITVSFSALGAAVPEVNRFISQFSPGLAELLGKHFADDAAQRLSPVTGGETVYVSDGIELQIVSAMRTDNRALIVIAVRDLKERGLFDLDYPDVVIFQALSDNGCPMSEDYKCGLDFIDPNTGVVELFLAGLTPDETINLVLSNLTAGIFEAAGWVHTPLSEGAWSFSFTAEHQEIKTAKCSVAFDEDSFYTTITEVVVTPFYVSLIFDGGDSYYNSRNDIYLLMADGSVAWMDCNQEVHSLSGSIENGTAVTGFYDEDIWFVDSGVQLSGGPAFFTEDGRHEKMYTYYSTEYSRPVADHLSVFLNTVVDIDSIAAIVINGEQIDF